MKKIKIASAFASCFLAGALCLHGSKVAMAQSAGPGFTASCAVLDTSCANIASTFVLTSIATTTISLTKAFLVTGKGTHANKPSKGVSCKDEGLYPPFSQLAVPGTVSLVPCGTT